MGAGTLKTLHFKPPSAGNGVLRRRHPSFPANNILSFGLTLVSSSNLSILPELRSVSRTIRASGRSDQMDSNVNRHAGTSKLAIVLTSAKTLINFAVTNFLPIGNCISLAWIIVYFFQPCYLHPCIFSRLEFSTPGGLYIYIYIKLL
ncbi:hypothetical protein HHK36_016758 [Tetracentron sinense]|uniref:Uncharacterized protein n=1 Tax=Tetracentron sinense TaxID=13715 RepID=A0A835DB87_TETSI|nr:hypothetical protein HHK36_016758 [Tetracentron sinense]